jgi:hypothetical protein
MTLMMVWAVVLVAAVMGMALLSSNTLQVQASNNQDQVLQADALAESGINLALYWLQNITDGNKCPGSVSSLGVGNKSDKNDNNLGNGVPGTFDISITRLSHNRYQVTSTGRARAASGGSSNAVQRTLTAQADLNYFGYAWSVTNMTSGSLTIPSNTTILGDVFASVPVTNNGNVTGSVYAPTSGGGGGGGLLGGLLGGVLNLVNDVVATLLPSPSTVNKYPSYSYNGRTYNATQISSLFPISNVTYNPDPNTNPAGVFYHSGSLTLAGNVHINGSLVLTNGGSLQVQNTNNSITQNLPNFPALVAEGDITFTGSNAAIDINGLTYIGGRTSRSLGWTGCVLNITGTLLAGGTTTSLDSGVTTTIKYDRVKSNVPSLVTGGDKPAPTSLTVVYWKN